MECSLPEDLTLLEHVLDNLEFMGMLHKYLGQLKVSCTRAKFLKTYLYKFMEEYLELQQMTIRSSDRSDLQNLLLLFSIARGIGCSS